MLKKASLYVGAAGLTLGLALPATAQQTQQQSATPSKPQQQMEQQSREVQAQPQSSQSGSGPQSGQQMRQQDSQQQTGQQRSGPQQSQQQGQADQTVAVLVVPVEFRTIRVDQLVGEDVHGSAGDEIGEINDVVMARNGKALAAVVDVGGFLGIGEKKVAVSFDQLTRQGDRIVAKNLTKETAENLTPYVSSDWRPIERNRQLGDASTR